MSQVFLVGDLHLDHRNICKYRPQFSSLEEHNQIIVDNVLSTGGKRDTLILMGDCFFSTESLVYLRQFKANYGRIWWILGNHDTDNTERQDNVFTAVKEGLVDRLHGLHGLLKYKDTWLSHAPIHPEELRGRKNIHAHGHDFTLPDTARYQSVSLEQISYKPIEYHQILNRFSNI